MNITLSSSPRTFANPFRFEQHILIWLSALVDIVFLSLSLFRYFRYKYQRTHLTYVYHFSLGFSILLSVICTPLHSLTEYYSSWISEQQRRLLCNFNLIAFFVASAGIGYSLAYASLERTFFIFFSQNIRLSWFRQFMPFLIIFSSCSMIITLFVLLAKCSLEAFLCIICYFSSLSFQFIWFSLQFLLPFAFMLLAISFLIYRIEIHTNRIQSSITRHRSKKKFHRILIHLNIYTLYYIFALCPTNLYLFLRLPLKVQSQISDILLVNYIFISLHAYPILIYVLTKVKQPIRMKYVQPEQKLAPYIIVTHPSMQIDEYERTRL